MVAEVEDRWVFRMAVKRMGSAMSADMGEPTGSLFVATIVGSHTLYVTRSRDPPLATTFWFMAPRDPLVTGIRWRLNGGVKIYEQTEFACTLGVHLGPHNFDSGCYDVHCAGQPAGDKH